jgi:hypothetical protein
MPQHGRRGRGSRSSNHTVAIRDRARDGSVSFFVLRYVPEWSVCGELLILGKISNSPHTGLTVPHEAQPISTFAPHFM